MTKTTKTAAARKTFNYQGPNLFGVSRVRVPGKGEGTLGNVDNCWLTSKRWCSVALDSGETVVVIIDKGHELEVVG